MAQFQHNHLCTYYLYRSATYITGSIMVGDSLVYSWTLGELALQTVALRDNLAARPNSASVRRGTLVHLVLH